MNNANKLTRQYYSCPVDDEWESLFCDAFNRLEYAAGSRFLDSYLPPGWVVPDVLSC